MTKRAYPIKRQVADPKDRVKSYNLHPSVKLAATVDLRPSCPPIFDQGQLGSCSANAGNAYVMMLIGRQSGKPITEIKMLSRLFQYYNERLIEGTVGEDAGAQMRDIGKAAQKYGVCTELLDPYIIEKFAETPTEQEYAEALNYKINSYHSLTTVEDIQTYLAVHQMPVLMGMEVFPSFESDTVAQTGIVPMPKKSEASLGGHAVLIVGYKKIGRTLYFIVRNSWGEGWGDKGYFYLPATYITKGYAFDFWVLE